MIRIENSNVLPSEFRTEKEQSTKVMSQVHTLEEQREGKQVRSTTCESLCDRGEAAEEIWI